MNFSTEQFQTLMAAITGGQQQQAMPAVAATATPKNDPAALGPIRQCSLGTDKMQKLILFNEWLDDAENRMDYIGVTEDKEKIILLKTWGGPEMVELIRAERSHLNTGARANEEGEPTYMQTVERLRHYLARMVNRTMAMHQLLGTKQGTRTWSDFLRDLEKKAKSLNFDKKPYTTDEAIKDAAIFGMNDISLREKALAEDPDLEKLSRWGQAREAGREDAHNLDKTAHIKRIRHEIHQENMTQEEIDDMIESLQVMKLKKAGKYSNRHKGSCNRCNTNHQSGRCPANGKECFTCGGKNHFARAPVCPGKKTVKRINSDYFTTLQRNNTPQEPSTPNAIRKVTSPADKWVHVKIGGTQHTLFADTGNEHTIITPEHYSSSMGPLEEPDIILRAWGSSDNLNITGMVHTVLKNARGTKINSKVYVVDGFQPEPLLWDNDAEQLGFITFNKEGKSPRVQDTSAIKRIPQLIRDNLNIQVETRPDTNDTDTKELEKIEKLVNGYMGLVFDDNKIGCITIEPIHLDYEEKFKPKQPPFRNVPIHYQGEVSKLLEFLRTQGVISDVDPRESYDCVMNVVITDKSNGQIRMNVDNTPRNVGMKRTRFHVQTPQEIRHDLKEAKIFSEMDMGWGYHQL